MWERELVVVLLFVDRFPRPSARFALHVMPIGVEAQARLVDRRIADLQAHTAASLPHPLLVARWSERCDGDAQRDTFAARAAVRAEVRQAEAAPAALQQVV